ncbi:hypothetical protein F0Q45_18645 [Mycobacterium simiae]|uniref:DUF3987 domain-containing protein n=1 Tax=Mycobacterium simiae TaxID=1784 RepID=A0A5B1BLC6_MYCSI|nr:hypothetical protein [Mycobacterium simiae]KAA1248801.1 hypothetical protein F0Q45_18645 [Mycobacterium simiae]
MSTEFWEARPALRHVLTVARARRVGPWAVLGVVLARAAATVPPSVALPKTVGSRMSLNLFIALVGPSGGGKGAATATAMECFHFSGPHVQIIPNGSGEGVSRTFRPIGTKPDDPNPVSAAIFDCPEVDTLFAIASRQGSTVSAELRKMYSGEQLGFANAGKDTRSIVEAGSYRACQIVGVQPLRSGPLITASDGGLPQRFAWLPTSDPEAPDEPPPDPGVWKIRTPAWNRTQPGHLRLVGQEQELAIPDAASKAIVAHRQAVLREDPNVDPLDGHALLTRLKIAAALMALDGRTIVTAADWSLAGYVMDVSTWTRERCQRALIEQSRSANTARALAAADREEIVSDRRLQRCKDGILRALSRAPDGRPVPHNQLRRSLKSDVRDYFDAAANDLSNEGRITARRTPKGVVYQGPPVDHTSTPSDLHKHGVDHRSTVDHQPPRRRQRTRGKNRATQQTGDRTA